MCYGNEVSMCYGNEVSMCYGNEISMCYGNENGNLQVGHKVISVEVSPTESSSYMYINLLVGPANSN